MKLRILDYLTDIQEFNGVSVSARLQCSCGATDFEFLHTGKQTKGIFAPFIVRKNGQLILEARCPDCHNHIVVFDSSKDGNHASENEHINELVPFVLPKSAKHNFSVSVKYNYFPENLKIHGTYSNKFENCFIYILQDNGKEGKALIEE